jgi:signal-transduction protein with cAMP-binding, CBS, and nucleotidyltransferase domain
MPMLLGTKENDILQWRASADLVAALKGKLARKWEQSRAGEAQSFLEKFIGALRDELGLEEQLSKELSALDGGIEGAADPGEMLPLQARYLEAVSAHFKRRRSVLALCGVCNQLHDRVLSRAVSFAGQRMLQLGQGGVPVYALLVSGDRGRREQTLRSKNRYFLLHEGESPLLILFRRFVAAALQDAGLTSEDRALWHGTLGEWRAFLGGTFPQGEHGAPENILDPLPPFAAPQKPGPQELPAWGWRLEALADLCSVQGETPLASEALDAAAQAMQSQRNRDPFLQLARRVIGLPVALGRFGRWRLQREGVHRGELNLEEFALGPLVKTLRVLALHAEIQPCGTVDRVQRLLKKGALDVELASRLLKAFQCFMQHRILSEIRGEGSGSFCTPQEFGRDEEARFRSSLEAVLSLQKITYQRLVGQG